MAKYRAKAIVTCIGGRLVYLESSIKINNSHWKVNEICEKIKEALFSRTLNLQKSLISTIEPESETIVKGLSEGRTVSTSDLIKNSHDKKKMNEVIHAMINKNVVRYNLKGDLKWHGKIQEDELSLKSCKPANQI